MDKNVQKIEGSSFAEYPLTKSDNGLKAKEKEDEVGYSSVFGEYKSEEIRNENKEKSTANQPNENKDNFPLSSFDSGTSAYSSSSIDNKSKESKEGASFAEYPQTPSVGLKSTVNQPAEKKSNLETSTGYNSIEGEYTSSKIENKTSKEGAIFAEYPQTVSDGLKSTIVQPIETKINVSTTTYNSITGGYSSSSNSNIQQKNSNEVKQTQPVLAPLIIKVPSNAPIISNNNIPIGNAQGSITMTSTTTTVITTNSSGISQRQPINMSQQMPLGQPQAQPLEGSTFAEYPQTVSHGIKSSNLSSAENQPK